MTMGLLRLATVGVFMFGGGVVAATIAYSPGLPLTGTECIGSDHCGPAPYRPPLVANEKNVFQPACPNIALVGGGVGGNVQGHVPEGPQMHVDDAAYTSATPPRIVSEASSGAVSTTDTFLAQADKNIVVSTAVGGKSFVNFVLYRCSTRGLAEQFVRIPVAANASITLETIRVARPQRR